MASLPITEGRRFPKVEASAKRHPIYEFSLAFHLGNHGVLFGRTTSCPEGSKTRSVVMRVSSAGVLTITPLH
jgi:hypothetical protein